MCMCVCYMCTCVCVQSSKQSLTIRQAVLIFLPFCLLQIKKGPEKGRIIEVVKRKIPVDRFTGVSLRYVVH